MTMSLGKDVIIAQMYTHVTQLINMTVIQVTTYRWN